MSEELPRARSGFEGFARSLRARPGVRAGLAPGAAAAGYQEDWLELSLPLPSFDQAAPGQIERRDYSRYTVFFDLHERLCRMSAAGVPARDDPEAKVWLTRDGRTKAVVKALVAFLAARHAGPFQEDGSMPAGVQVGWPWYDAIARLPGAARAFDKGHMMDRLHLSFGPTPDEAKLSMAESYFFTNVIPQTPPFNERDPKAGWPHIEQYVMALSKLGARVVHWTGPIFDDAADPVVTTAGLDPGQLRVPCRYWKIVAAQRRSTPASNIACAFVLDDTERVQTTVAAINGAAGPHAVAADAGGDGPLPDPRAGAKAPAVYWKSLSEVGELAGFDVSAFDPFVRPVNATGRVRSTAQLVRSTARSMSA